MVAGLGGYVKRWSAPVCQGKQLPIPVAQAPVAAPVRQSTSHYAILGSD